MYLPNSEKQVFISGEVALVGTGPGDPDLLTLQAYRFIQQADIVIYDRLVSKAIMELVPDNAELIYVGKKQAEHRVPQDVINQLLVDYAKQNKKVLRLKGGDPFVFGRGGEEALYLNERGIRFEIIPGITSAISVPAYAGIPVTHRGITPSFRVVTGHRKSSDNIANINWSSFIENETIIFLMGLHNISLIVDNLIKVGKAGNYPCAIISNGTTKKQKVITGTLDSIIEKSNEAVSPAIIVVGEVVNLREELNWFEACE